MEFRSEWWMGGGERKSSKGGRVGGKPLEVTRRVPHTLTDPTNFTGQEVGEVEEAGGMQKTKKNRPQVHHFHWWVGVEVLEV